MSTVFDVRVDLVESLDWHQQPIDSGQIVDVFYAIDLESEDSIFFKKIQNRLSNEVLYQAAVIYDETIVFEPWNNQLPQSVSDWHELSVT